jgi:hypothetical protein
MSGRIWAAVATAAIVSASAATPASADEASPALKGTPFESGANAAALPQLARGQSVRRSSLDGTLNADDRSRLGALGLGKMHSAAVVLHRIPKTDQARQVARLKKLVRSVDGFAPSGACDGITSEGEGTGLCTGSVDGPLGKIPVRMPVAAKLTESDGGAMHLAISNMRPMEAKPLFSWSPVVEPGHLKVVVDFYPEGDAWLVYTRVAVEMSEHESSAKTISDALLKLDAWLSRDLAKS